jgi:hypothetical protein
MPFHTIDRLTPRQTKHLQESLAECGWEDAARVCQQDTSEAFTFITGALELPLLTLKMDIYHTGRENKEDDHKFVNERLLEVAIPEQEGQEIITLEDCLETYFNNRIEVKRFLQRQNTMSSLRSVDTGTAQPDLEKNEAIHIESVEITEPESPMTPVRPSDGQGRTDSIFGQRYTRKTEDKQFDEKKHLDDMWSRSSGGRPRSASLLKKEVLMPAWQFFSLIRKQICVQDPHYILILIQPGIPTTFPALMLKLRRILRQSALFSAFVSSAIQCSLMVLRSGWTRTLTFHSRLPCPILCRMTECKRRDRFLVTSSLSYSPWFATAVCRSIQGTTYLLFAPTCRKPQKLRTRAMKPTTALVLG